VVKAEVGGWLGRLADFGALPTDTAEERLRKSLLITLVVLLGIVALSIYVVFYWSLGLRLAASIPFAYQVVSVMGLIYLARTKDFTTFRTVALFMALTLPVSLQWALGGFAGSGAILLWAAWPAIGDLMFEGPRNSTPWFVAYLGMIALATLVDPLFHASAPPLSANVTAAFFGLNVAIVTGSMYFALRYFADQRDQAMTELNRQHILVQLEQTRSEGLLLSILPRAVAERLKHDPRATAERYADVTVLFADIVDFTPMSSGLSADELVAWLNELFSEFDRLSGRYRLEKIKTIGDAYMAVGGVPTPHQDHVGASAELALAMRDGVAARKAPNGGAVRLRIGIHTGAVVAGVIGTRKFSYDLWGDTVNIASRMESQGVPDGIQVTETTYRRLRDRFDFAERAEIYVKGKGLMTTYLLLGKKRVTDGAMPPAA
jgi:adenylate cyclase